MTFVNPCTVTAGRLPTAAGTSDSGVPCRLVIIVEKLRSTFSCCLPLKSQPTNPGETLLDLGLLLLQGEHPVAVGNLL